MDDDATNENNVIETTEQGAADLDRLDDYFSAESDDSTLGESEDLDRLDDYFAEDSE